jgi:radical SAM protein with 4Fe4S-binding SPASM domain
MKALINRYGYVPETCVWELTRACNLRCGHCGTSAGRRRPDELTTAEAVDVARQLVRLGNRLTTLSGGEPTLREDWPQIARALIDGGARVNMVTNGQTDGCELAVRAKDAGLANVGVSIDGLRDTHDALRGPGAFDRAVDTIRHLVHAGFWVDLMFTVNRVNLPELVEVWGLAGRLGIQRVRVQLGKPMGNQTHRDDLTLQPKDLLTLLPLLGRLAVQDGPGVRIGDSVGYYSPDERVLRGRYCEQGHWTGCYAGVRAIGIQADGSVKWCLSLQPRTGEADRFIEGNVRAQSLESIWFKPGAFAYNRAFDETQLKGACARCTHASLCRGGATCVAYTFSGELGCDPMCYYQVVGSSEATRQRVWPLSAPAAAAAIVLSLTGCGGDAQDQGDETGETGGMNATGGSAAAAGTGGAATSGTGGVSSTHTGGMAVGLDYGIFEPTGGTGGQVPPSTGGRMVTDYGIEEPTGGTGGQVRPGTGGEWATDYGIEPPTGGTGTGGEWATDYGIEPPTGGTGGTPVGAGGSAAGAAGSNTGTGGAAQAGSSGTGNEAGAAGVSNECASVCCMCDYGIIEPETYAKCCS